MSARRPNARREKLAAIAHCAILLLAAATQDSTANSGDGTWRFSSVSRVVAVSDLHGAYDSAVATLQAADVLDENLAWSGQRAHLVVAGDILDRGAHSRLIADLLMRLEAEAKTAGGRVHVLLGNHEVMNLVGDLRYVADEEYAAFADEESAEERAYWQRRFMENRAGRGDPTLLQTLFEERAPPGFFAHRRAFAPDGRYGSWLLAKSFLIVINDTAYVHGGLPPMISEYGLAETNLQLKDDLIEFVSARTELEDAAVIAPTDAFRDLSTLLPARLDSGELNAEQIAALKSALGLRESKLHRSDGPLWYRGSARCSTLSEGTVLSAALDTVGASRVVIGHTTTATRKIQSRHGGRVLEVNTGMLASHYGGSGQALIIADGNVTVVDQDGERSSVLVDPPRRVGNRVADLDDDALSDLLATGRVLGSLEGDGERQLVRVTKGGNTVPAYFEPAQEDGSHPTLAAYETDKVIGLNMVPVTVRRSLSGHHGSLQLAIAATTSEAERLKTEPPGQGTCSIDRQRDSMRVFNALISQPIRTPTSILYDEDWNLILTNHRNAFSQSHSQQIQVVKADGLVNDEWQVAIAKLRDPFLTVQLRKNLSAVRVSAFLSRLEQLASNSAL